MKLLYGGKNMEDKLIEIIANELGVEKKAINLETEIGGIPEWDSLHNVQVFGAIEIAFEIEIQSEQIMDLETVKDILEFLEAIK